MATLVQRKKLSDFFIQDPKLFSDEVLKQEYFFIFVYII